MSRQFWMDFLSTYMSMPCLWQVKSKDYSNRDKKREAYAKLTNMCREIEPGATKEYVVKKINSYRTTFRKEYKKYIESIERFGAGTDNIYTPSLWYYDILLPTADRVHNNPEDYLDDSDIHIKAEPQYDDGDYDDDDEIQIEVNSPIPSHQNSPGFLNQDYSPASPRYSNKRKKENENDMYMFVDACRKLSGGVTIAHNDDEFDNIGKNVAAKLRALSATAPQQRIIAEKLISDILFYGQLNTLTLSSAVISNEDSSPENFQNLTVSEAKSTS